MSEVTAVPLRPIAKGSLVRLWLGIGLAVVIGIGAAVWATQGQVAMAQPPTEFLAANAKKPGVVTTPSGLQYLVQTPGVGPLATPNDVAILNYEGRLLDGSVFDTNATNGGPVQLPVAGVVPGFSEALQHMNAGARYRVWIPPQLAYGAEEKVNPQTGKIAIPANSLLIFDIDLVAIAPMPAGAAGGGMDMPH